MTAPSASVQSNGAVASAQPVIAVTANGSPSTSPSLSSTPSTALGFGVVSEVCGVVPGVLSTRSSVLPSTSKVSGSTVGASFTGRTLTVIALGVGSRSTPPLAVPPLSRTWNVNVAYGDPNALSAGWNRRLPAVMFASADLRAGGKRRPRTASGCRRPAAW